MPAMKDACFSEAMARGVWDTEGQRPGRYTWGPQPYISTRWGAF